jgi:hypothetical protein
LKRNFLKNTEIYTIYCRNKEDVQDKEKNRRRDKNGSKDDKD